MVHSRKHFLLVAFPAYGHLIPLLELGRRISKHHHVTFAVSACMLPMVSSRNLMREQDFPLIGIPDGCVELDFNGTQMTDRADFYAKYTAIMSGARKFFMEVPAGHLRTPSHNITFPIDVVIADNLMSDPLTVFHTRGVPYHFFNSASIGLTLGALLVNEDTPTLPETGDGGTGFVEGPAPGSMKLPPMSFVMKALMLPIHKSMHLVSGIVVNSIRDIEDDLVQILNFFPVMKSIPVRFVGPLVSEDEKIIDARLKEQTNVETWLNRQENRSVVYVSFGSVAVPTEEQTTQLVKALLQLGKPFIFSLAVAHHKHLPDKIRLNLTTQFETGQSLILPWAPQKLILQHPATSVFLSHCGWNSTMESVYAGVPLVAWPMFADQKTNAEGLAKRGMALMVQGTGLKPERVVPSDEIAKMIGQVAGSSGDTTETSYRIAAHSLKLVARKASSAGGSSVKECQELMA